MKNMFQIRDNLTYNLRSQTEFLRSSAFTSQYDLDSLRVFTSKVWNIVPTEMRSSTTLNIFKENITKWEPKNCNCKLWLSYTQNVEYVNVI